MNLKVIQWLIGHREALLKIVELAKSFDRSKPYIDQWDIIDKIARIVVPLINDGVKPAALASDDLAWKDPDAHDVGMLEVGGDLHALGIDWRTIIDIVIPIVIAILQSLSAKPE